MKLLPLFLTVLWIVNVNSQEIAILKYNGGGDWYANPTALPNLIRFCNENIDTEIEPRPQTVDVGSSEIFQYPFLHMTGHGNVFFTPKNLPSFRRICAY